MKADDKIVAVMVRDAVYGEAQDISDIPKPLVDRLQHYFSTYKLIPGVAVDVTVAGVYGREHALEVVSAALADYQEEYGAAQPTPDGD